MTAAAIRLPEDIIVWRNMTSDGGWVVEIFAMRNGCAEHALVMPEWAMPILDAIDTERPGPLPIMYAPIDQTDAPVLVASGLSRTGPLVEIRLPNAMAGEVTTIHDPETGTERPVVILKPYWASGEHLEFPIPLDQDVRFQEPMS